MIDGCGTVLYYYFTTGTSLNTVVRSDRLVWLDRLEKGDLPVTTCNMPTLLFRGGRVSLAGVVSPVADSGPARRVFGRAPKDAMMRLFLRTKAAHPFAAAALIIDGCCTFHELAAQRATGCVRWTLERR